MGWWQEYDGTVIGDEMADIVDEHSGAMVKALLDRFPKMTKGQLLHIVAFGFSYVEHFDKGKENEDTNKVLQVMTKAERDEWTESRRVPLDESQMIAPGTSLLNMVSPFVGKPV